MNIMVKNYKRVKEKKSNFSFFLLCLINHKTNSFTDIAKSGILFLYKPLVVTLC